MTRSNMDDILNEELDSLREAHLFRSLRTVGAPTGREVVLEGRSYLHFSSNNYLSLAGHPEVRRAAAAAAERWGAGGTSSRLVAGTAEIHRRLEERLAAFKGTEDAIVFPSGYQTNAGVISSLAGEGDCLILDRLDHASMWDAAKMTKARLFVYPHRDLDGLEKVLKRARDYRRRLIVTDTVFSMDGDLAPLAGIADLAERYGAWTMVDEAHGAGVFGTHGRGLAEHCGVEGRIDIIMGTLSKSLGAQGGYVCGSRALIDYIVNRCRSFIYTTALAPASCGAALAALDLVEREPERRAGLLASAARLRAGLAARGFDTMGSESQIVPLFAGDAAATVRLSERLRERGILAPAIRPPTVPEGTCRLRFSLTYDHTPQDLDRLLAALAVE